jgi:hypothetical protein
MVARVRWVLWVAVVVASGCAPKRVHLGPLPPVTSELEARRRALTFDVVGVKTDELHFSFSRRTTSESTRIESTVKAIELANGAEIEDPRDLIPVVGPHTNTAETANVWARARASWAVPATIASVSSSLGFVGVLASFYALGQTAVPLVVSLGVALVVPLVTLSIAKGTLPDVSELLVKSFSAYVDDLALLEKGSVPAPNAPPAQ